MDDPDRPQAEPTGKVLAFPGKGAEPTAQGGMSITLEGSRVPRRGLLGRKWFEATWVLSAWIIAERRLSLAVEHREVFGAEAITAFLLFVSMPAMHARRIAATVRHVVGALRSSKWRRGGETGGPEAPVTALRRRRAKGRRGMS